VPSPELRCLECDRQFADLTADQEVERCAECGKFVVTAPTGLTVSKAAPDEPLAELVPDDADIPTVGKAKPADELPLARPAKAAPPPMASMPAWARRADEDAPPAAKPAFPPRPAPTASRPEPPRSYTELPSQTTADRKQKVGIALFVAFLFLVGMVAAIGVLGYTIIRGLQMKKVLTDVTPAVQPLDRDHRS